MSGRSVASSSEGRRFAALHSRSFRALWIGLIVSNAGSQMQNAAQAWLVRDLHREPIYLGLLSLSFALPMLVLTPIGGAIADRVSPRLLVLTQTGMMLQAIVLAALTLGGWIQFWQILALSFVNAVFLALDNPARQALLPDLVEREQLPSAVSLNSVAWTGAGLFGPAIAGVLLGPLGPGGLFALNAVSFVAVLWALVRVCDLPREARQRSGSILGGMLEGFRYVAANRTISQALLMLTANNVLGRSYLALMPVFARDVLEVGPDGYGLLLAAPGAGALLGGLGLAAARNLGSQSRVAMIGWFGFAAGLALFAWSRSFALSLAMLFLAAVCTTVYNASTATLLQLRVAGPVRGRVLSLMATSNIGGGQFGGVLSGALATFVGAPDAVLAAVAALVVVGLVALLGGRRRPPAPGQPAG